MTTPRRGKALCSTCKKASGILICQGCRKDFCFRHVAEHRQELNLQLDELAIDHDQLQQTIAEQEAQPHCHPLMKEIDQYEQQATEDIRQQLLELLAQYRVQVANHLTTITNELKQARYDEDFMEIDLKRWKERLNRLQASLDAVHTIDSRSNDDDASTEMFDEMNGDVQIEDEGKIAMHGPTNGLVAVRCRGEYSLGQHRFRFRIERTSNGAGFIYGIVSKNTPMDLIINRIVPNANGPSDTGSLPYTSLNNNVVRSFLGTDYGFQSNGTYEVFIDCYRHIISLTNEQIQATEKLYIDETKFPLPWQFFVAISYVNDRICLC